VGGLFSNYQNNELTCQNAYGHFMFWVLCAHSCITTLDHTFLVCVAPPHRCITFEASDIFTAEWRSVLVWRETRCHSAFRYQRKWRTYCHRTQTVKVLWN